MIPSCLLDYLDSYIVTLGAQTNNAALDYRNAISPKGHYSVIVEFVKLTRKKKTAKWLSNGRAVGYHLLSVAGCFLDYMLHISMYIELRLNNLAPHFGKNGPSISLYSPTFVYGWPHFLICLPHFFGRRPTICIEKHISVEGIFSRLHASKLDIIRIKKK